MTLDKAIATLNRSGSRPDFIVVTGDLTQTTDDVAVRRRRMGEFKRMIGALDVKDIKLMPGEHDAALDEGATYRELFGPTHDSFEHKGVHFVR